MAALSCMASGQDTLRYGDPWYMYTGNYPGNYCDTNRGNAGISGFHDEGVQLYVAPPEGENLVYGVAITMSNYLEDDEIYLDAGLYRKVSDRWFHDRRLTSFAEVKKASHEGFMRYCRFHYMADEADPRGISHCYEYYFSRPVVVTDSFYVGFREFKQRPTLKWFGIGSGEDYTFSQRWWTGGRDESLETGLLDWASHEIPIYNAAWGGVFPIVRLRCTTPRPGIVGDAGDDWVQLLFDNDGEEHTYEVSYATLTDPVDTTAPLRTSDTAITLTGLEPNRAYWYRVRRSCRIQTDSMDVTVWSDWSRGTMLTDLLGTNEMILPDLEVRPNPASTVAEVTVEGGEACSVELVDVHGRTVMQRRAEGGSVVLDLAGLPPAVYTLRALTARGAATRRLVVAR